MRQALRNAFGEDITECITETNSILIEVFDCYDCIPTQQRSYIKTSEGQPVHFTLRNPLNESLIFAALDNCILRSNDVSRCDFTIGNFRKLYFVEIKQVNTGQRATARKDAIQQLHSSIALFRNRINLQNTDLNAVICLKAKQAHPVQSAKRVADIVAFKENFKANLMEGQIDNF
ncbi:MAG TPA: hypothetical protein VNS58_13045 [Puia sp.]|nr:hypothetical protein [Puia sp.]